MTIGSVLSGFDRFAGYSGSRVDTGSNNGNNNERNLAMNEAAANPARVNSAWDAQSGQETDGARNQNGKKGRFDKNECETCNNRSYQDGSNDPGVSFKAPTKMSPEQAATAVRGHEQEHVTRNQAEAKAEGREVISQSVILHTGICPECGRTYVAGGETRTVTGERKNKNPYDVGREDPSQQSGRHLDAVA